MAGVLWAVGGICLLTLAGCSSTPAPPATPAAPQPPVAAPATPPRPATARVAAAAPVPAATAAPVGAGSPTSPPAAPPTPTDTRALLERRMEVFLAALRTRDYPALWRMYDDELKEQGGSEAEYLKHMQRREGRPGLQQTLERAERQVEDVTVVRDKARVQVRLNVPDRGPEVHVFEWNWDEEARDWFFAGEYGPK